jgi:hypothetical protein
MDPTEQVEVARGITKPLGECTPDDLRGALQLQDEAVSLHSEMVVIVNEAADGGVSIPDDLGQRLKAANLTTKNPLVLLTLRDELRAIVGSEAGDA